MSLHFIHIYFAADKPSGKPVQDTEEVTPPTEAQEVPTNEKKSDTKEKPTPRDDAIKANRKVEQQEHRAFTYFDEHDGASVGDLLKPENADVLTSLREGTVTREDIPEDSYIIEQVDRDQQTMTDLTEKMKDPSSLTQQDRDRIKSLMDQYSSTEWRALAGLMGEEGTSYEQFQDSVYQMLSSDDGAQREAFGLEDLPPEVRAGSYVARGDVSGTPMETAPYTGAPFQTKGTGYYPPPAGGYASAGEASMEGGGQDSMGNPLRTLDDYLYGNADYVSVAMDHGAVANGTELMSQQLDAYFRGKVPEAKLPIRLIKCDTGGAFAGKGTSKMDICCANQSQSVAPYINQTHTVSAYHSRVGLS